MLVAVAVVVPVPMALIGLGNTGLATGQLVPRSVLRNSAWLPA